jgi:hypothetical protein
MISDVLSRAATELREHLSRPTHKVVCSGSLRQRIESLITELDAIRTVPDMGILPEAIDRDAQEEALDQMYMEKAAREIEETEEGVADPEVRGTSGHPADEG